MSDLLGNLLEWSRSQRKVMNIRLSEIRIVDVVKNCIDLLNASAMKKNIRLINNTSVDLIAFADMEMLTTVLRNLIQNAIKFTDTYGTVSIEGEIFNNECQICVRDNGIGIKPDMIDRIFQLDETHQSVGTANEKGTGLGLMICKDFIKNSVVRYGLRVL